MSGTNKLNVVDRLLAIQPFDKDAYKSIDLNRLTVFGLAMIDELDIEFTFERVTIALFRLFPCKFSMAEFPQFPDATRVNRALLQLRPKYRNWATGSVKKGYRLTQEGKEVLSQTEEILKDPNISSMPKQRRSRPPASRDKGQAFMSEIEESSIFERYISGRLNVIDTNEEYWEFLDLLHASEGTDSIILHRNLERLEQYAESLARQDIIDFLKWIRKKFKNYLK
jgi:hypothetical protein